LLDSQIGNLLTSKFGDRCEVERMIGEGKLLLLPCSDIRGFDTSGMRAGVYISEAQNMSVSLMKLALQRIGDDGICIIDGDCKTQVDDINFAGSNNGMRRVSKVFRGEDIYGEVTLKNIHRSRIGQIAENM
jgi:predicted ribonuclease YlaK